MKNISPKSINNNKPLLLWSHPRSASSEYLAQYCNHKNLLCDITEPLQNDTSQLHNLVSNKISFKVMPHYLKNNIVDMLLDLNYEHVFLFRKDIYRVYLSYSFGQSTNIFHSSAIKGKINLETINCIDDGAIKHWYSTLDKTYAKSKNNILMETGDAIKFLGNVGYQGTDQYYEHFRDLNMKLELEKFVKTLKMYYVLRNVL